MSIDQGHREALLGNRTILAAIAADQNVDPAFRAALTNWRTVAVFADMFSGARDPGRAHTIAASIRQALTDAEREFPADEVITRTAVFITGFRDLQDAFDQPRYAEVSADIRACLFAYKWALQEAVSPAIKAQRFLMDARNHRDNAEYHRGEAADDEAGAERFVEPVFAEQWRARAARHRAAEAAALAEARRLEDRARELGADVSEAA